MEIKAICLDKRDNVVTLTQAARQDDMVTWRGCTASVTAAEEIPQWHKIALVDLKPGDRIYKYGEVIGEATAPIARGHWVSDKNIHSVPRAYAEELLGDDTTEAKAFAQMANKRQAELSARPQEKPLTFWGYRRPEGRPGVRNHVLILPTCACGSETARIVASQVRGAVYIIFNTGCSDVAANTAMSQKVLTGFATNPNVYGVVIIGLGCETVPHKVLREKVQALTKRPVVSFGIQEEGGTLKTIEKAVRAARIMAAEAGAQQKEEFPISELLLGIECGDSDATSGIAANPAVGNLSDRLVDLGATAMMSESIEWIGGEHVLARRAATPALHDDVIRVCEAYEQHLLGAGQDCRAGQPTPGNKAGGLSTIDEKSLGCIRKGGTRPISEVLEQAVRPTQRGALVMDTAGYDISSVTSMVAAGCNIVFFTTGRGTPTGNAIVPVCKVTANEHTYNWLEDNMDVDLSGIIRGEATVEEMGAKLLKTFQSIANGQLTKAEAYGFSDIAVDHVCRFV